MAQAQAEQKKQFTPDMAGLPLKEEKKLDLSLIVPRKMDSLSQIAPLELKNRAMKLIEESDLQSKQKEKMGEQIVKATTVGDVKDALDKSIKYDPIKLLHGIAATDMDYRQKQNVLKQQQELAGEKKP
ncbi:MAG: hypothetical protein WCT52_01075 [Candidatus Micrarchaeia archaeon]